MPREVSLLLREVPGLPASVETTAEIFVLFFPDPHTDQTDKSNHTLLRIRPGHPGGLPLV